MCGDVNLFLSNPEEKHSAEIEIMVAEHASRRRGLAQEALTLMMAYAYHHLGITMFFAKVGEANGASVRLFTKLGFTLVSFSQVFQESTLELRIAGPRVQQVRSQADALKMRLVD